MTPEQNDLLCRVEGAAPMGQLMRQHWMPACMIEEVAEPDGTPLKVRLLGEDMVVFRDTNGRVGALDEFCPHRRAPLDTSPFWRKDHADGNAWAGRCFGNGTGLPLQRRSPTGSNRGRAPEYLC